MASTINPRGNINSPLWVITDVPYKQDTSLGSVYSCNYGRVFERCLREAGMNEAPFFFSIENDLVPTCSIDQAFQNFLQVIDHFKPPIILSMGKVATALFCPETKKKLQQKGKEDEASLEKYAGSLLVSPYIKYPHYVIPQLSPDRVIANWAYKLIYTGIDLRHAKEELNYFKLHKSLQPLPEHRITIQPTFCELEEILFGCEGRHNPLGSDIETIRFPRAHPEAKTFPGMLYVIGFAWTPNDAVSFCPWDYTLEEQLKLWRHLNRIYKNYSQVGQNYFRFDAHFFEAFAFEINLSICYDTIHRHQILWPELPHKLQFLTKQYTRTPYYKDEGKSWTPKHKKALMHYNGLDNCNTLEVYLGQEEEFDDRPYLR